MTFTTAILLFFAWQMFGKGKNGGGILGNGFSLPDFTTLSGLLNDDVKSLLSTVNAFGSKNSTGEEKAAAIFQLLTNPALAGFTSNIFGNGKKETRDTNDAGYVYNDNPSNDAKEFFKPIENIAGTEASHKLYQLYDNWYSKNTR